MKKGSCDLDLYSHARALSAVHCKIHVSDDGQEAECKSSSQACYCYWVGSTNFCADSALPRKKNRKLRIRNKH